MKIAFFAALTSFVLSISSAAAATLSMQQSITLSGQMFSFGVSGPPSTGAGGMLSIALNGDFSGNTPLETSTLMLDGVSGSLELGYGTNWVTSNTISGLIFGSVTRTVLSFDDVFLKYDFTVSATLLNTILANGMFSGTMQNGIGVDPRNVIDGDFVGASLTYNNTPSVPIPASLPLLMVSIGALGFFCRSQAQGSLTRAKGSMRMNNFETNSL